MFKFEKLVFGDLGWGDEFLYATLMTILVSVCSMGLGIFIAQTLLERTGAELSFSNRREGGAVVEIQWPRDMLEGAEGEINE